MVSFRGSVEAESYVRLLSAAEADGEQFFGHDYGCFEVELHDIRQGDVVVVGKLVGDIYSRTTSFRAEYVISTKHSWDADDRCRECGVVGG